MEVFISGDGVAVGAEFKEAKFAKFSAVSATDTEVVAAVSGKRVRVLDYVLCLSGTSTARFEDGAGGTELSGLFSKYGGGTTVFSPGYCPVGHFQTSVSTALSLETSSTWTTSGHVTYVEVG